MFLSTSTYFADSASFNSTMRLRRLMKTDLDGDFNSTELSPAISPGVTNSTTNSSGELRSHNSSSSLLFNHPNASTRSICNGTFQNGMASCQDGFLSWNPDHGVEKRNPCVKRIVKTYLGNRNEVVTEYECRRATFYCPQSLSGMGLCQAVKVFHSALGRILTVGCKCKPRAEL